MENIKNFSTLKNWKKSKFPDLIKEYHGFILCLSGGVDSTALFADFIDFLKSQNFFTVRAFHTNFGLRGNDSEGDEQFLRHLCDENHVPFDCYRVTEEDKKLKKGRSTQEWARLIRYRELIHYEKNNWCIIFAHTRDDLAENSILRMSRGTSLSGLAGMSELHGCYWRPFLDVSKSQIHSFMEGNKLPHREDASNAKIDYSRNKIRHLVLPELEKIFPGAKSRIARFARESSEFSEYVRSTFYCKTEKNGNRTVDLATIQIFSESILKEYIVYFTNELMLTRQFNHQFLARTVEAIQGNVDKWSINLPQGGMLKIQNGKLHYCKYTAPKKDELKHKNTFKPLRKEFILGPKSQIDLKLPNFNQILTIENAGSEILNFTFDGNMKESDSGISYTCQVNEKESFKIDNMEVVCTDEKINIVSKTDLQIKFEIY